MAQTMSPSNTHEEVQRVDEEELMRSYVQKGKFKIPDPNYDVDEKVHLEYEDYRRRGTFIVTIATEGKWNADKQDIEYQLKLADGTPYKNGEWIGEKTLKNK
ncbi:hypothetical protein EG329_002319 [Mollisiaceae sp. DMI_Dod_QoI]|nr:hypothetical protein EG329_002319 [Helotiales sp. DMI_Dod_QoI]